MVDRTIAVRLRAHVADFKRDMGEAAKVVDRNAAGVDTLSNQVGVLGTALTGFAALAVTRFAQFDKQMSSVQAATRTTGAELDSLRQAAIRAGADTAFSATEAAAGIENLAKAGIETTDILNGGLDGALALAAAGNLEVADAAEIAAVAMQQFKLEGSDVGHVADLLAAGAGKAVGEVSDLSQALNQAGLIAAGTGLSIEETTATLSAFASAGLIGSDAGTSFKTMLQVLSAPSAAAEREMKRLGIAAYDVNGAFVGMEALAGQLETAFKGKTDAERNSALATIFGTDAVRAANELYNQGAQGIADWTDAVDDQGYAAEQARIANDNLIGDLERLAGSFDTVLIQSGSGANGSLRTLVQTAEALVDAIGQIPAPVLTATTLIAGGTGLALLGAAGMGKLLVATRDTAGAYRDLVPAGSRADRAVRGVGRGAVVSAGALGVLLLAAQAIESTAPNVSLGVEDMRARLRALAEDGQGAVRLFEDLNSTWVNFEGFSADSRVVEDAEQFQELLRQTADPGFIGAAQNQLGSLLGLFGSSDIGQFQTRLADVNTELAAMASGDDLATATEAFTGLTTAYKLTDEQAGQLLASLPEFRDALIGQADAAGLATDDATLLQIALGELTPVQAGAADAADQMAGATEGATGAVLDNTEAIRENLGIAAEAAGIVLSEREAQRSLESAIDDATASIKENGATLDVTTEKGRANQSALDAVADGAWAVAESMYAANAPTKDIAARMQEARDAFIRTAMSADIGRTAAGRLADELGLVPGDVETILSARDNATGTIDRVKGELQGLQNKTITITTIRQVLGSDTGGASQYVLRRNEGGRLPGFLAGGRLPGDSPADPMTDNLLGVDEAGMPRVRVRSREWVVSEPAADYYGDGVMSALNARAIPREMLTGLPGLAAGGEVGAAREAALLARRDFMRARRRLQSARTEAGAESAKERLRDANDALQAARARLDRLEEERTDLRTSLRRGDLREQVTGGLSGAYSAVDSLRSLANSGDVGKGRKDRLNAIASHGETQLKSLYSQAERVDKKLTAARDNLEKLQQVAQGVKSGVVGGFGLAGVAGTVDQWSGQEAPATGSAMAAAAATYASRARRFNEVLGQLWEKSGSAALVQEIAGYGVEQGLPIAESLLADLPALRSLAASYAAIDKYGTWAGATVARAVGGGQGLTEAALAVQQAEAQAAAIDKRIGDWAKRIGNELSIALGVKTRASGGPMFAGQTYLTGEEGPELVTPTRPGFVHTAAQTRYALSQPTKTINLSVTNYYPQAEPTSVTTNRVLQDAAAVGI